MIKGVILTLRSRENLESIFPNNMEFSAYTKVMFQGQEFYILSDNLKSLKEQKKLKRRKPKLEMKIKK